MYKNLLVIAIASLFFVACGNQENTADKKVVDENTVELASLTPDNFYDKCNEFIDKSIKIQGTITHVCSHGGKKMFIFGEDPEISVKLTTGENMAAFNTVWEGSDVIAEGIVREFRVDEEYLASEESKIQERIAEGEAMNEEEKVAARACGELLEGASVQQEMDQIEGYRTEIAESGDDHLSFYSIEVISYEIVEPADSDLNEDTDDHEGHDHDAEGHEGHDHD